MEIRKKQFTYKGKTIEELKALDVREFAKYLKSGKRRNALRRFQEIEKFVSDAKEKIEKNKKVRTHKRDLVIVPGMVGMRIQVHDGKNFVSLEVTEEMLGHKLGEFAQTRGRVKHGTAGLGATKGTRAKAKK